MIKKNIVKIILCCIVVFCSFGYSYVEQYILDHKVLEFSIVDYVSTVDGDTAKFKIEDIETTVRFLSIDTPESVHPTKDVEPYGIEASNRVKQLLDDASVIRLEYEDVVLDYYDRTLAWIFIDDQLLQEILVEEGLAIVAYEDDSYKYTKRLYKAQERAKKSMLNIWSN